jgi:hypothetical protein
MPFEIFKGMVMSFLSFCLVLVYDCVFRFNKMDGM